MMDLVFDQISKNIPLDDTWCSKTFLPLLTKRYQQEFFSKLKKIGDETWAEGARALVMGFESDLSIWIANELRSSGATACARCSSVFQILDVAQMRVGFTHLIVNMDGFADIGVAIDTLMEFRILRPHVVVIVLSENVSSDTLDSCRKSICDVTMRLPLSQKRLSNGILAANCNNVVYRSAAC
jgi:hypothetical protein